LRSSQIYDIEKFLERKRKKDKLRPRFLEVFVLCEKDLRQNFPNFLKKTKTVLSMISEVETQSGRETPAHKEAASVKESEAEAKPVPGLIKKKLPTVGIANMMPDSLNFNFYERHNDLGH
jgi:hypothetical protein